MKDSEVLREARNILFERGHTKGLLEDEAGAVCVHGACNVARYGRAASHWTSDKSHLIADEYAHESALRLALTTRHPSVWGFNDDARTTFDDVLSLLDRAEKFAEQREADAQ